MSDSEDSKDDISLGHLLDMKSTSDLSHVKVSAKAPIVRARTDGA
jgi:hypothetical protein